LACVIGIYWVYGFYTLEKTLNLYPPLDCYSQIERASCVPLSAPGEGSAIEYIRAHTSEYESIFVGNRRHDKIFINDIGFYFLTDRQNASRYTQLEPGVATTLSVQQEIVMEIESKKIVWVVLVNAIEPNEPNGSAISSGIYYLDDYIKSTYSLVAEFGDYQILKRITR
jgi:hypothetical protein